MTSLSKPASPGILRPCAIIAHRGASRQAPENTLGAVCRAWELGSDGVEIDIRLSRDGAIVVIHDATTRRTTGKNHAVSSLAAGELQQLNAAATFGHSHPFEPIPLLEQILATVPPGRRMVIEIKDNVPEMLDALDSTLSQSGLSSDQIMLGTFDCDFAAQAKRRFPAHEVLWINGDHQDAPARDWPEVTRALITRAVGNGLDGLDIGCCHPHNPTLFFPHFQKIRESGLKLLVWTVNDPAKAELLRSLPVDGITTDVPEQLIRQEDPAAPPMA